MKKTFRTSFIVSTKVSDSNSYQQGLINRKNKSTSLKYEMQNVPLSDRNNIPYAARLPKAFTKLDTIECFGQSTNTYYRNPTSKRVTTKNLGICNQYQKLSWKTQTPRFYGTLPFNWREPQKMVPTTSI